MRFALYYIQIACAVGIFVTAKPNPSWEQKNTKETVKEILSAIILWPIFVAGVIYGYLRKMG